MKVRDDVLVVQEDLGTSGTKQWDLNYTDVISELVLRFGATVSTNGTQDNPLERNVSKIEIVDGSDVLWSLPGDVAYSLAVQAGKYKPYEDFVTAANGTPEVSIPIQFGRFLYDPTLGFVPRNFKNPQLKVTFDEATVTAAGADGYVSDSFVLSITARLMEEAPSPEGWLMAKDLYDFTSVASGDEKVVMPTDYPWRQLFVRAYETEVSYASTITNYKLNCDRGKFIPFDSHVRYIVERMASVYPMIHKKGYSPASEGDNIETWIGEAREQSIVCHTPGHIATMYQAYNGIFTVAIRLHDGTTATTKPVHWIVSGYCPHNTVFIPFGRLDEIGEWFNAPQYGSVDLYLTQGNAGAEVNVCVQQLRKY